jgi:hypothetical protein
MITLDRHRLPFLEVSKKVLTSSGLSRFTKTLKNITFRLRITQKLFFSLIKHPCLLVASTVVEHSTQLPKVKGLSAATTDGTRRENMANLLFK